MRIEREAEGPAFSGHLSGFRYVFATHGSGMDMEGPRQSGSQGHPVKRSYYQAELYGYSVGVFAL